MTLAATHQSMPANLKRGWLTAGNLPFPAGCSRPKADYSARSPAATLYGR